MKCNLACCGMLNAIYCLMVYCCSEYLSFLFLFAIFLSIMWSVTVSFIHLFEEQERRSHKISSTKLVENYKRSMCHHEAFESYFCPISVHLTTLKRSYYYYYYYKYQTKMKFILTHLKKRNLNHSVRSNIMERENNRFAMVWQLFVHILAIACVQRTYK